MAFAGTHGTEDRHLPHRGKPANRWLAAGVAALLLFGGFGRRPGSQQEAARAASTPGEGEASRAHGRLAKAPSEIPARGWRDILVRVYHKFSEDRVTSIAGGATYFTLLAIFPGVAALVSVYGLFADPQSMANVVQTLSSVLPQDVIKILDDQLHRLTQQPAGKLGATFAISLAGSLWSANAGMKAMFDALNIVYHEQEKRSFIVLNAVSLAFTLGMVLFGLIALAAVAVVPAILERLPRTIAVVLDLARWPILLLFIATAIAVLYRYGPSRDKPRWKWVSWGSALASVLWIGTSMLFSWYAANFASYNQTYGSLGAIIVFMTWIWISVLVILLGAELNAEMEHQTARDTTEGPPEPLGMRGAHMADTVGAAH
jgi:membrane protein